MSEKHTGKNNPRYRKVPWNKGVKMWEAKPHPRGASGKVPWNRSKHIWKGKEHPRGMLGKGGYTPWNKNLTKENDKRVKGACEKMTKTLRSLYNEGKLKPSFIGRTHTATTKSKISKTVSKLYTESKITPLRLGKKNPKQSVRNKIRWENPEYRENVIKKVLKNMRIMPTSLERKMIDIIEKYNLPYKYVGDGDFILGGKNPDFVNVNGEKIKSLSKLC